MRRGVQGFQNAIDEREWRYRPGGEVERVAGRFLRPILRREAQEDYIELAEDY